MYGIDVNKDTSEILDDLREELTSEKDFDAKIYGNNEYRIITYQLDYEKNKVTNLCLVAGLPNEQFERAERVYKLEVEEYKSDAYYVLQGELLGGALAQYAGLMSEGHGISYQVVAHNGIGITNLLEFKGNEFLGYRIGLMYYLNNIFYQEDSMDIILEALIKEGLIKDGNISSRFRKRFGEELRVEKIKEVLIKVFYDKLSLKKERVVKLVNENFNPFMVQRKMRLIDKYREYKRRTTTTEDNIFNYVMSQNISGRILKHVGDAYILDENWRRNNIGIDEEIKQLIGSLEKKQLEELITPTVELFTPYILLKEGGNGKLAMDRSNQKAEIGYITNNIRLDYLSTLVKDIIVDLKNKDEDILKTLYTYSKQNRGEIIKIIKDRLRHSIKLQKKDHMIAEIEFKSEYFKENRDLFTKDDKTYFLDKAVLEQLENRMYIEEIYGLWGWEKTEGGVFILLGTELEESSSMEYRLSNLKEMVSNKQIRLKIEVE